MLAGLANGRTVNLSHLASQFPGMALHASSYRRLQRFFQHVRLDGDVVAQLIFRLLDLRGAQLLALDRTNWKLGKTDINILVLAIVTRRFKVPLMWSFLSHRGNSSVKSEMCWIICLDAAPPRWVSRGRFVPRILRSVRL